MEINRIIKLTFFFLFLLSFITLATPLAFANFWLRNVVYILVVILAFFAAKDFKHGSVRIAVKWLPILVFGFLIITSFTSLINPVTDGWKTVSISYRNKNHLGVYIGRQMLDIGARGYANRIVKVTPITPLLNWVTPVDTTKLGSDWIQVSEDLNPYHWKY